jgi:hypothetical protein
LAIDRAKEKLYADRARLTAAKLKQLQGLQAASKKLDSSDAAGSSSPPAKMFSLRDQLPKDGGISSEEFDAIDINKDGVISREEFEAAFKESPDHLTPDNLEEKIKAGDEEAGVRAMILEGAGVHWMKEKLVSLAQEIDAQRILNAKSDGELRATIAERAQQMRRLRKEFQDALKSEADSKLEAEGRVRGLLSTLRSISDSTAQLTGRVPSYDLVEQREKRLEAFDASEQQAVELEEEIQQARATAAKLQERLENISSDPEELEEAKEELKRVQRSARSIADAAGVTQGLLSLLDSRTEEELLKAVSESLTKPPVSGR